MVRNTVSRDDACMVEHDGVTYCLDPLEEVLQVLSKRWALLVVGILGNRQAVRFNEAKRHIPGITPRGLSEVLAKLQGAGLVERLVDAGCTPPAVSYRLTSAGESCREAMMPLVAWASKPLQ